ADVPYADLLRADIEVIIGEAELIDRNRRVLRVAATGGAHSQPAVRDEPFDYLICAVGAAGAVPDGAALAVWDAAGASSISARLSALQPGGSRPDGGEPGARCVVVGGGATGVETAAEVAERHPGVRVTLVAGPGLMPALPAAGRRRVLRGLERLGVGVVAGDRVARVEPERVVLDSGRELPSAVTIWAGAPAANGLARASGLPTDEQGRLLVDETLRCPQDPAIFGAGDAVRLPDAVGGHLRASCAAAIPLGGHAADSVLAQLRGQTRPAVSIGFMVQCTSLGRRDGLVQFVRADDRPRAVRLSGRLGARAKESICRLTLSGVRKEGAKPRSYRAPKGPRRAAPR
ncbi:MAG: FAD-dependent oxidoreductase, partial [Frankiaceae bacterium]|nr:FAD-dependent oxidoreductase [Frankiaceae bacterium]